MLLTAQSVTHHSRPHPGKQPVPELQPVSPRLQTTTAWAARSTVCEGHGRQVQAALWAFAVILFGWLGPFAHGVAQERCSLSYAVC